MSCLFLVTDRELVVTDRELLVTDRGLVVLSAQTMANLADFVSTPPAFITELLSPQTSDY